MGTEKQLYVIEGTELVNENAPFFEYSEGGLFAQILEPITLKLLDRKLKGKFNKGLEEFKKEYKIRPMFAGTPKIHVYALNEFDALKKVREDKNLIEFFSGLDLNNELSAHPYISRKQI